jgi:hypothetical protein
MKRDTIETDGRKFLLDALKLVGISRRDRILNFNSNNNNDNNNNNNNNNNNSITTVTPKISQNKCLFM